MKASFIEAGFCWPKLEGSEPHKYVREENLKPREQLMWGPDVAERFSHLRISKEASAATAGGIVVEDEV